MERIAVIPGSFDPVTRGHESIVKRSIGLFDRIIIALGENSGKTSFFPLEQRLAWLREIFASEESVSVASYKGLTVEYCRSIGAAYILRGLRTSADFEFERGIGQMNRYISPGIETIFLLSEPEYSPVSSSVVRDIYRNGGDISRFIPEGITIKT